MTDLAALFLDEVGRIPTEAELIILKRRLEVWEQFHEHELPISFDPVVRGHERAMAVRPTYDRQYKTKRRRERNEAALNLMFLAVSTWSDLKEWERKCVEEERRLARVRFAETYDRIAIAQRTATKKHREFHAIAWMILLREGRRQLRFYRLRRERKRNAQYGNQETHQS